MSETQTVTAKCGCKVEVFVKTEAHHFFDHVSSVEITEPCEAHGATPEEPVETDPTAGMTFNEKLDYWGDRVRDSRSPKQLNEARAEYNRLIDSLHPARAT